MFSACMIDGFGRFAEADYRRCWLAFGEVDYVFPVESNGELYYPSRVFESREYRAVRWPTPEGSIRACIAAARADLQDPSIARLLADEVPGRDAEYAWLVVGNDPEFRAHAVLQTELTPALALAFLANKLIVYALAHGLIPVVGRSYASKYLALKLAALRPAASAVSPLTPRRYQTFTGLASGLSLSFVSDRQLAAVEFERLRALKTRNERLLRQHQLYLLESAQAFQGIPEGPDFDEHVAALRVDAERQRLEIENATRHAWVEAGFELAKKAIVAGSASATTGFALLRTTSLVDLLAATVPGVATGIGVGVAESLHAWLQSRRQHDLRLAYLMELSALPSPKP